MEELEIQRAILQSGSEVMGDAARSHSEGHGQWLEGNVRGTVGGTVFMDKGCEDAFRERQQGTVVWTTGGSGLIQDQFCRANVSD